MQILIYFINFFGILLFSLYTQFIFDYERFFDTSLPEQLFYDYIIIGSGSSGSVIASQLEGKILLVEAGGKGNSFLFSIPIFQPLLQKTKFDWSYKTISLNDSCQALNNSTSFWPMGRILGGTHRLNNMVYHRGFPSDYEDFISRDEAEKYFGIYEKHAKISAGKFRSKVAEAFLAGSTELGFEDFDFTNLTQKNGRRFTQVDHLETLENPPEILTNAFATRILFDDEDPKKAIGIEFEKQGIHQVFGNKIVISAGTVGSPKLLLLSGIGPAEHLREIGIKVRENLPVGENLQDHVTTGLDLMIMNQTTGLSVESLINPLKIFDYFVNGGSMMAFGGSDAMGFVKINKSEDTHDLSPDLSFMLLPLGLITDHGLHLQKIVNIKQNVWENHFQPLVGKTNTISILPILLKPKSKGSVKLKSKNYNDEPLINPNYFSDKNDVKRLITGIRIVRKLIETKAMQKLGAEINPKKFPGCLNFQTDSDSYWECYLRQMTLTMYHPVGTCKIGEPDDASTVVLKNFQVKNIQNLFVVDASIIPKAPSANPHALISMIAQKFVCDMSASRCS